MATPLFGFTSRGSSAANQITPPGVAGLTLWLDSSDTSSFSLSGTSVLSWTDKKSSRVFTPVVSGTYPVRTNPVAGVNFPNGGSDFGTYGLAYNTTWYLPTQYFTMFVVYNPTANSMFAAAFGITSGNVAILPRPNLFSLVQSGTGERTNSGIDYNGSDFSATMLSSGNGGIGLNTIRVDEVVMSNTSSTSKILTNGVENTYANGPDNYTGSYSNYPVAYTSIAANSNAWGSRTFTGNVYEIVIYNRAVTTSERTGLENYFYLKWMFKPTNYSSNIYWFDAADTSTITTSGTTVTAWANKGSATMTLSASTGTVSSGTATKNGKNVISFPASSRLTSQTTNLAITVTTSTFFVVYQKRSNLTTGGGIDFLTANNPNVFANPSGFNLFYNAIGYGQDFDTGTTYYDLFWTVNGGYCFTSVGNTPPHNPYVYQLTTDAHGSAANRNMWFFGKSYGKGGGPGQTYTLACEDVYSTASMTFKMGNATVDWDMAEYIIYNRSLTTSERQTVEGYLSIKWGIPLDPSHPYAT